MTNHTNTVQLLGHYGGDITHAQSAWTSTTRELDIVETTGKSKRDRIPALLKQLADAGHETPFEKSALHFLITAEDASHIHMLKHRIGVSVNGESARYKELNEDKFYIPQDWPNYEQDELLAHCEACFTSYHRCLGRLVIRGFTRKRAKESARFYLPKAAQLKFDVQFNFRSFVHFQRLRNDTHAQDEIHSIAHQMLNLVALLPSSPFYYSIEAFNLHTSYK